MRFNTRKDVVINYKGASFTLKQLTATQQADFFDGLERSEDMGARKSAILTFYRLLNSCLVTFYGIEFDGRLRDDDGNLNMEFIECFSLYDIDALGLQIMQASGLTEEQKKSSELQEQSTTGI